MFAAIKKRIAGSIGRRIFQRAIRGEVPDYVSDIRAVEYPIPIIRSGVWPLVVFSYQVPFERDVLVTGWDDYTKRSPSVIVVAQADVADVRPGRVYTRLLPDEQTRVWLILDASGARGCFYLTGMDLF